MSETENWWVDGVPIHGSRAYNLREYPLSAPERRGEDVVVARRPGSRHVPDKPLGPRTHLFVMDVWDEDEFGNRGLAAFERNLDWLKRVWYGNGLVEVERRFYDLLRGRPVRRKGRGEVLDAIQVSGEAAPYTARLNIELFMADPFWYEEARTVEDSGTFEIYNPGNYKHHNAKIRISGPATNPQISCAESGSVFAVNTSIGVGQWLEIDTDALTVLDHAATSWAGALVRNRPLAFELRPGRNAITVSSGTCELTWKPVFL